MKPIFVFLNKKLAFFNFDVIFSCFLGLAYEEIEIQLKIEKKEKSRQKLFQDHKLEQDRRNVEIIQKINKEEENMQKMSQNSTLFLNRSKEEPTKIAKERVLNTLSRVKNLENYRKSINESYFFDEADRHFEDFDPIDRKEFENLDLESNCEENDFDEVANFRQRFNFLNSLGIF